MVEIIFSSHAQGAKKIKMYNIFTSQGFWNKSYENFFDILVFFYISIKVWTLSFWRSFHENMFFLSTVSDTSVMSRMNLTHHQRHSSHPCHHQMIINHQSNIKYPIIFFTKRAQSGRVLFFRILFRHCWRAKLSSWRGWFRSGGHQSLARTKKCQELLLHKNIYENHLCYIFAFCKFRSPGFVRRHISHWQDHLKTYIRYHDGENDDSQLVSLMMCATW